MFRLVYFCYILRTFDINQAGPEVEMAKKTYEALNAQLLDELPQLYRLCVDLIQDCLVRLVGAQKQFHEDGLNEMYKLLGVSGAKQLKKITGQLNAMYKLLSMRGSKVNK